MSTILHKSEYCINENTQIKLEEAIINGFDSTNLSNGYMIGGVHTSVLGGTLNPYIHGILEDLDNSLRNLRGYIMEVLINTKSLKKRQKYSFMNDILEEVPSIFQRDTCIYTVLRVLTYSQSDKENLITLVEANVSIGKRLVQKYFSILKEKDKSKFFVDGKKMEELIILFIGIY